jgi:hypothetical protein
MKNELLHCVCLTAWSEVSSVFTHSEILRFKSHALGISRVDLVRSIVKYRHDEVSFLVVLSVSLLFFLALHQELNMLVSKLLVLGNPSCSFTAKSLAFLSPLFEMLLAFIGELVVLLHALSDFFLCLSILSEEHLPASDIVHGLVLVSHEVSLDHGAIFHR